MTALFVHGVPDTHRVWNRIRAELGRDDVVAVDLPGFGAPVPDGFDATKEAYAAWLTTEVERLAADGPVDLVGHDWGGNLVQRVASLRPELVRTVALGGCPVDEQYTWHEMAQLWQTPGVGEHVMDAMTPEALSAFLTTEVDAEAAAEASAAVDDTMKRCILSLYRSAVTVGAEWQPAVDAVGGRFPALVLWGRGDTYVTTAFSERLAQRLHAELVVFECGHWWPYREPAASAAALERLWARG
ncbi:MAG TPA: alpha/beta hydrolase [Acidimicrobiia bacterium]|nr:alpha/beta hydrolase [Acidimicrobiia bacterium]